MGKLYLQDAFKVILANKFRNRINKGALSKNTDSVNDTAMNLTQAKVGLTGNQEILDLNYKTDGGDDKHIKLGNNLNNNLLLFTVKSNEIPKQYLLYRVDGSTPANYYRECIITISATAPGFDTARQLRGLTVEIKGDGE